MENSHYLTKTYHGFASKNQTICEGSEENCTDELDSYRYLWRKNGANITYDNGHMVELEDYGNHGETVTFEIKEIN